MRVLVVGAAVVVVTAGLAVPAQATERTITYRGYELTVPADWPVFDLATEPSTCVRFDRNAVYLGTPGAEQRCAASVKQITDAVLLEPSAKGVQVTVTGDRLGIPSTRVEEPAAAPVLKTVQPGVFTGPGFDTCAAPSQRAMDAWLGSPFRAIGVYIGGIHRACAQPNLTAGWIGRQVRNGWHIIPTYVGIQAPCTSFRHRVSTDQGVARTQGREGANDAIAAAAALGLEPGTVIYNDMEAYNTADGACSSGVMAFLSGWTDQLRERGYRSGVYSSAGAGITNLVHNYDNRGYSRPDHIWFAWWNDRADVDGGRFLPNDKWRQRRIHQFDGDHEESYNGVPINIDTNYLDVRS